MGGVTESGCVRQSQIRPRLHCLHQTRWLSCAHHTQQVLYIQCVGLCVHDYGFKWTTYACVSFVGHHQWSRLKSGIRLWATSPPLLRLGQCSHLLGTHTDRTHEGISVFLSSVLLFSIADGLQITLTHFTCNQNLNMASFKCTSSYQG